MNRFSLICFCMLALLIALPSIGAAQGVAAYSATRSTGITFTSISSTGSSLTWRSTSLDDARSNSTAIGFTFTYLGTAYTTFSVSTNGYLDLSSSTATGSGTGAYGYENTQFTSTTGTLLAMAPLYDDQFFASPSTQATMIKYQLDGTGSSHVLTVEWIGGGFYNVGAVDGSLSYQVKLYESSNTIEFVYGTITPPSVVTPTYTCGINAATMSGVPTTAELLTQQTANTATFSNAIQNSLGSVPASNSMITFSMAPMVYDSSTTTQNTVAVPRGTTNQQVIGIKVFTTGANTPLGLTQLDMNTTGTTSVSDITNARIWYTGTSSTFATGTQFGSDVASPSGSYSVTGSQTLQSGTNYFWLTYDIPAGATINNFVDGECTLITLTDGTHTLLTTAPSGNRQIKAPLSGTYTILSGGAPPFYPSVGAAVSDLNTLGISGAVTFNVRANNVFRDSVVITTTGTAANPIRFVKDRTGANPVVMRYGTAATNDAIITLNGADYITFDGIDLKDSTGNVEYGFYFAGASATNGCLRDTVRNDTLTQYVRNVNSRAIYLSSTATASSGANSTMKFVNNTIRNFYTGFYLNGASAAPDSGNEVNGATLTNLAGGSGTAYGVYLVNQTAAKVFSTNISNMTIPTAGSGSIYGIYSFGTANAVDIYSNDISSMVDSSSLIGTIYGIYISSGATTNVYSNTIHGLLNPLGFAYGMYITGGTTNNIYKNKVYDVSYTGISTSGAVGIGVFGGSTNNVYNNMVYDVKAPAGVSTTAAAYGLSISAGTTDNVFYNSVLLNYTSTTASNISAAVYVSSPTTIDMRNNVFVNTVDVTTGTRAVALRRSTTGFTNFAATTNNNLYYAGTPSLKHSIMYDGTNNDTTLAQYKTRISTKDQASVTENPPFLSVSTPYNLHLNTGIATQCESGGSPVTTPIAVADDIDGNARNASTPDIGADEGAFTLSDITAPAITYTALLNTISTGNDTLTSTITDASGVPTAGPLMPRIYYKKGVAGTYFSKPGALASGSGTNGTWKLPVVVADMGGVTSGDTVYYYVIAQDIVGTPNLGSNPGGAVATDVNTVTTPPASPNSFRIIGTISGVKTVGISASPLANYPTITAAVADLNNKQLNGPLTLSLIDASYPGETYPITINANGGSSATNTVTIKPATGVTTRVAGTSASSIFKLNGADYVTIDGSNNGTTSRDMTVMDSSAAATTAAIWIASQGTGAGAKNNTIKNCVISAGGRAVTNYGISVGGSTIGTSGADNDSITIQNNVFPLSTVSVYAVGTASVSAGGMDNLLVTGNSITDSATVANIGIQVGNGLNCKITQNTINIITTASTQPVGISLETGFVSSTVDRNKITRVTTTATGGYGGRGITVGSGTASSALTIANNLISGVNGSNYSSFTNSSAIGIGIGMIGSSGTLTTTAGGVDVYYNSVNMFGSYSYAIACITAGIYVGTGASALNIKDNIIVNSLNNTNASGTASKNYAVYSAVASSAYSSINYDDYYVAGLQGMLGFLGANDTTIAQWRTATGQDLNSLNADPSFVDTTNLQPYVGSPVLAAGTTIAGITTDYVGAGRSGSTPSIGAYETGALVTPPNPAALVFPANGGAGVAITDSLRWASGGGVPTGYKIYFGTDNPPTNIENGTNLGNVLKYNPTPDMTLLTWYYWQIIPYNSAGDATGCPIWSFRTVSPPLAGDYTVGTALFNMISGKEIVFEKRTRRMLREVIQGVENAGQTKQSESNGERVARSTPQVVEVEEQYNVPIEHGQPYTGSLYVPVTASDREKYGLGDRVMGDYATITAAVGDLNGAGITAPVRFLLTDSNYPSETFPITITQVTGATTPGSVIIRPNTGVTSSISGSSATAIFMLNGSRNITIDGSNSGGADRNLTIQNTNAGTSSAVVVLATPNASTGTINNVIENCIITGKDSVTTLAAISGGGVTVGSFALAQNVNNMFANNLLGNAQYGILIGGVSTTVPDSMLQIVNNAVGSATGSFSAEGIRILRQTNGAVSGNEVQNVRGANVYDMQGIDVVDSKLLNILGNKIHYMRYGGTSTNKVDGITTSTSTFTTSLNPSANTYANNVIYDLTSTNTSSLYSVSGINNNGGYGDSYYFNSVFLTGSMGASAPSFCFSNGNPLTTTNASVIDVRDNIFYIKGTATGAAKEYAIYTTQTSLTGNTLNYNDLLSAATGPATSVLGYYTADRANLAAWQTATAQDANSISTDPLFFANDDLRPYVGSPVLHPAGVTIAGITTDYIGATRNSPPSMGAYEEGATLTAPNSATLVSPPNGGSNVSTLATLNWAAGSGPVPTGYKLYFGTNTPPTNIVNGADLGNVLTYAPSPMSNSTLYYWKIVPYNGVGDATGSPIWSFTTSLPPLAAGDYTVGLTMFNKVSGKEIEYQGRTRKVLREIPVEAPKSTVKGIEKESADKENPPVSALQAVRTRMVEVEERYAVPTEHGTAYTGPLYAEVPVGKRAGLGLGDQVLATYTTITAAVADINARGITGPVRLLLDDASYPSETFPIIISPIGGASATNTITIKPNTGVTTMVSGTSASSIFKLNGADYITFDGSNTNGGTTRDMTIMDSSASSGTAAIWIASAGASAGATNNTIKNCNIKGGGGTSGIYGIVAGGATVGSVGADNDNLTIQNNSISRAYAGIWAEGSATTNPGLMDNVNITGNSLGSLTVADYLGHDGIVVANGSGGTISRDTVFNIITGNTTPVGLTISTGFVSSSVTRNAIGYIVYTGTGGYGGRGMYINTGNASSADTFANNAIFVIGGDGYSSFANSSPVGMYFDGTSGGFKIYYNSISMTGSLSYSAATVSAGILFYTSTITGVDLRNNAFENSLNNTVNASAKNYAIYSNALATSFSNINYNDYHASGVQGVLGYLGGDKTSLSAWATATGQDVNSISELPPFTSVSDLHIPNSTATQLESGGTPIAGITVDFDGQTRNASTPDIGADEFAGIGLDLTAPDIIYTPLTNTHLTTNRTLVATISDSRSGVQRSASGAPRIYFKKGVAGAYTAGTAVESPTGTYTFTINHGTLGGVVAGDSVFYYVAAQDSAASPNAGSNPAGTSPTINPPNATVALPNFYRVSPSISGSVTIGGAMANPTAIFPTVKAFFDSVNASVVIGNITATITSDITEVANPILNNVTYSAGGPFTITMVPAVATAPTITGPTGVAISLNGADYVIIDGRPGGTGTTKGLTIQTGVSGNAVAFGNGATHNMVRYCILKGTNTSTSSGVVVIGTTTAGIGNSYNTIEDCDITSGSSKPANCVYISGTTGVGVQDSNNTVQRCNITNFGSYGVYISGSASVTAVDRCDIHTDSSSATSLYGIYLGNAPSTIISRNKIYELKTTGASPTIEGIQYFGASGAAMSMSIYNNFVSVADTNAGATIRGIDYFGYLANSASVDYNSVYIGGSGATSGSTYAIVKRDQATTLNLRNNIAVNARSNSTGTGLHYAIAATETTVTTLTMNYNDYYVSGTGGMLGLYLAANETTLAQWQTRTGRDLNSIVANPLFVNVGTNDLHVLSGSPAGNIGTTIAGITDDFDGDTRNASTPDIGADEFGSSTVNINTSITLGWNMIANPVTSPIPDDSAKHLFPTIISRVFYFGAGYVPVDTMGNGIGYWGKFPAATTNSLTGLPRTRDSISVKVGWNMVGSISNSVDTATIVSVPPGIRASNWFGFGTGYIATTPLVPGKAYWVKSSSIGKFVFANPAVSRPAKSVATTSSPLDALNTLTITDSKGGSQTLYFGADAKHNIDVAAFVMPPLPPIGAMDARFETADGGTMVQTHAAQGASGVEFPVTIQSDAYPVTVTWKLAGGAGSYMLTDGLGGRVFPSKDMTGEGTFRILHSAVNRISVKLVGDGGLPVEYALSQNYPNPFNPTTTLKYALPVDSRVTMELYNILGQRVRTLVNDIVPAGYHVAEWDGTGNQGTQLASGVYFLQMSAKGVNGPNGAGKSFTESKKLMMMK